MAEALRGGHPPPPCAVSSLRRHAWSWEGEEQRSLRWLRCATVPRSELDSPANEVDSRGHGGPAPPLRPAGHHPPPPEAHPHLDLEVSRWPDATLNSSSPTALCSLSCCPLVTLSRKAPVRAATAPLPRACDTATQIGRAAPSGHWSPLLRRMAVRAALTRRSAARSSNTGRYALESTGRGPGERLRWCRAAGCRMVTEGIRFGERGYRH
jgi:hypothetical protein